MVPAVLEKLVKVDRKADLKLEALVRSMLGSRDTWSGGIMLKLSVLALDVKRACPPMISNSNAMPLLILVQNNTSLQHRMLQQREEGMDGSTSRYCRLAAGAG